MQDWHAVSRETFRSYLASGAAPTAHRDSEGYWFLSCRPRTSDPRDPLKRFVLSAARGGVRTYRTFEACETDLNRLYDAAGVRDDRSLVVERLWIDLAGR